jgi:hypothetical protein
MKFEIGAKRYVVVKKDEVRMFEDGSNKIAQFTTLFMGLDQFFGDPSEFRRSSRWVLGPQKL